MEVLQKLFLKHIMEIYVIQYTLKKLNIVSYLHLFVTLLISPFRKQFCWYPYHFNKVVIEKKKVHLFTGLFRIQYNHVPPSRISISKLSINRPAPWG